MNNIAIVLGGGLNLETQKINLVTKTRFDKFLEIQNKFDYIICTGNKTYKEDIKDKVKIPEAKAGYNYLISKGINKSKIIVEDESRDTFSNAYFIRKKIESLKLGKNITIITSNFHMKKSQVVFEFVFDNSYTLHFISVDDSMLNQDELEKRKISEKELIQFYNTHLKEVYNIKKGDMKSISLFIEKYNPATCGVFDFYHQELTRRVKEKIGNISAIY